MDKKYFHPGAKMLIFIYKSISDVQIGIIMELNVPTSGIVSHESPAVVQLHEDTKVPVSEIKAKLHDKVTELTREHMSKPSETPFGDDNNNIKEEAYKEIENELVNPEESEDAQTEEFKNFFGDEYPGSEAFAAPSGEDEMLGGAGDFGGGDFGGGIDNNAMGFSDDDMATLNDTADSAFDDFTAEDGADTAADVNNISAEEPGADDVTEPAGDEAPADEPNEEQA